MSTIRITEDGRTRVTAYDTPINLGELKDDLGIPAGDTTDDAWLQRRVNGIWARFQQYTSRPLLLSSNWIDDWGTIVVNSPAAIEPPLWRAQPSASVYLRVFPVQSIVSLTLNGATVTQPQLYLDKASGKLVGLDGMSSDLRGSLASSRAVITYQAGFEELPADLYEALLGVIGPLYAARKAQAAGVSGMITRIATTDVGEVEMSNNPNIFVEATLKGVGTTDPLLGPYGLLLDTYVDWRSMIGGAYASTQAAP